jgi:hypothetical protein
MSTSVEMTCAFHLGELYCRKVRKSGSHIPQHQNIVITIIDISQRQVTRSIPNFEKMFEGLRRKI